MVSTKDEPTFAQFLKRAMKQGGESYESLARKIGQKPATFRQWLKRGTFPDEALQAMAVEFRWSGDLESLRRRFDLKSVSSRLSTQVGQKIANPPEDRVLKDAIALMDERLEDIDPHGRYLESRTHDVSLLMGAMRKRGDVFIYWSLDEIPYEMRSDGRALAVPQIVQAVASNASFIYLHPDERALEHLRNECGLRRLPLASAFEGAFNSFRRALLAAHASDDESAAAEFQKQVDRQVVRIATPVIAFASPGHKYILFQTSGMQPRAFGVFPTGTLQKPRLGLSTIPLDQDVTTQFLDFANACLLREGPHRAAPIVKQLAP